METNITGKVLLRPNDGLWLARPQFLDDLLGATMAQEQRPTDKDQHIVAIGAACGHQLTQRLGGIEALVGAVFAVQEGFMRGKAVALRTPDGTRVRNVGEEQSRRSIVVPEKGRHL